MLEEGAYLIKMVNVASFFVSAIEYEVCYGVGVYSGRRSYRGRGRNHRRVGMSVDAQRLSCGRRV